MDRITAKLGEVYVIPSSVDETLIVPKRYVDDLEGLQKMVRDINASEVRPEDQLSNNIYEYDPKTHSLKIAGDGQTQSEISNPSRSDSGDAENFEEEQGGQEIAM